LNFKETPHDIRPHVSELIQEAGFAWLKGCADEKGFSVNDTDVRVDGYNKQKFFKGKRTKPITFNTLDFNGILTVTEPTTFIKESLYKGIGPAKAFGCGLMLVRRV
jgi:CRISPR system Cascade subunit CasE